MTGRAIDGEETAMLYPVAIERGDTDHAFGVVVPDLPGCFSAGDTFEEALVNAREAIELHVEGLLDAAETVPVPSRVDELLNDPDLKDFIWAFVDVPAEALDSKIERVNVTFPKRVLHVIDLAAQRQHKTRSAFLAEAALFFEHEMTSRLELVTPKSVPKFAAKPPAKKPATRG